MLWLRLRLPRMLAGQSLDSLLGGLSAARPTRAVQFAALEQALDRGERWANRVPLLPSTCLYRSLARYALFCRYGLAVEFVMGISQRGTDEDGHAWLELDGKPYREGTLSQFIVSFRYSARRTDSVR